MTRLEALVSLNMFSGIGSIRLKRLLEFFDKPEDILKAKPQSLMSIEGVGQKLAHQISAFKKENLEKEFAQAQKYNLRIITFEDKDYPENLKNIPDPPIVLYILGELKAEDKNSIALVGSRRASFYGLSCAEKFAGELSSRGFTIVSGMARGVDTCAHRGAIKRGGRTIAVLGNGFNHIYPPENKGLAQEIVQYGAIISEFPIDTLPLKQNFPRRNRVISGLSLGVLVIEAARNSGALITADFALEQGREVFALPGKVDSQTSIGTNGLIKQGAKLISCTDDIMEEFNLSISKPQSVEAVSPGENISDQRLNQVISQKQYDLSSSGVLNDESILLGLISHQPILLDDLVDKTNLNISIISDILLRLQMKRLIRQLPGKQFIRN